MKRKIFAIIAVLLISVSAAIALTGCKSVDDRVKDTTDELNKYLYTNIN